MKLPLAYYGNPILRKRAEPVEEITDEILTLIEDMTETMHKTNGMGIAAPQVKQSLRLFITCVPFQDKNGEWEQGSERVFINPKILSYSELTDIDSEGCLSIPGLRGDVERPIEVLVEATNEKGETFTETFRDLDARCILHENDHINGVLYVDRMSKRDKRDLEPYLRKIKKEMN